MMTEKEKSNNVQKQSIYSFQLKIIVKTKAVHLSHSYAKRLVFPHLNGNDAGLAVGSLHALEVGN